MTQQEQWKSKFGFVLAAGGSAIGLGAIWKFPYVAGTGGGGAFLLIFLLFTILLGLPLLIGEFVIGRKSQSDAITTYKKLTTSNSKWQITGIIGVITGFLLLSFYSVVGGWIILYIIEALTGSLNGLTDTGFTQLFSDIIAKPFNTLAAQAVFMLITIIIVAQGVQKGIEKASKLMMPALFLILIVLVMRSVQLNGALEGIRFLFVPDFTKLTSESILFALGQAFFTLSVGISGMVTYASYLPKSQSLPYSAFWIVLMNIFIILLSGLMIFPGVFTFGFEPNAGPILIFAVLPAIFSQMPFGIVLFLAFLILFLFAALTSAFSMIEIIVAAITKNNKAKRKKVTWYVGLTIFIIGIPSCLSYGVFADFHIFNKTFFDFVDFLVSNILMPFGALLISIFITQKVSQNALYEELKQGSKIGRISFTLWYYLLKYVVPVAIIIVFLDALGVLDWVF